MLERDMPPVFDAYYSDPENQHCKKCGHIIRGVRRASNTRSMRAFPP